MSSQLVFVVTDNNLESLEYTQGLLEKTFTLGERCQVFPSLSEKDFRTNMEILGEDENAPEDFPEVKPTAFILETRLAWTTRQNYEKSPPEVKGKPEYAGLRCWEYIRKTVGYTEVPIIFYTREYDLPEILSQEIRDDPNTQVLPKSTNDIKIITALRSLARLTVPA